MPFRVDHKVQMTEVGERARNRDVGQRQLVADQEAAAPGTTFSR